MGLARLEKQMTTDFAGHRAAVECALIAVDFDIRLIETDLAQGADVAPNLTGANPEPPTGKSP